MLTRSKHNAPSAIAFLAAFLSYAAAQPASGQISTVFDPVGDTFIPAPPFQDIVGARMMKTVSGDFELLMELAGSVSGAPILPPRGANQIWWNWVFDLDPTAFPQGYPVSPGIASIPEFIVYVSWNGTAFSGTAIDRRPLLTGGPAVVFQLPFDVNGTTVEALLDSSLIGEVPPSFDWRPATLDWAGPLGSGGYSIADSTGFAEFSGESDGGEQVDPYACDLGYSHGHEGVSIWSTSTAQLAWQHRHVSPFESLSGVPAVQRAVPRGTPKYTRNPD
jgi:hypothetical protein